MTEELLKERGEAIEKIARLRKFLRENKKTVKGLQKTLLYRKKGILSAQIKSLDAEIEFLQKKTCAS